ncbi:zinc-ribbon domain-containing protein [Actibacterium sp. D379-3]
MRLICPNCDAQYEVDSTVIPSGGRDVQCSNCGHTWFQPGADDLQAADMTDAPAMATEPDPAPPPDITPEIEEPEPAPETPAPRRKALDDSVLDVLREEAEREAKARRSEARAEPLESQPDLGLEGMAATAQPELQERMARLRGVAPDAPETGSGARRDLLPDIEEINSTLRATSDRQAAQGHTGAEVLENTPLPRRRNGFGLGFGAVVLIGALAAAIYILAPKIVMMVPATQPFLTSYVAAVNAARDVLNGNLIALTEKMTEFVISLTK